ncbi:MAG: hypothetical protein QME60_09500, partial [Verrucomicrobiota bacterium]|nr:hypothetical protein [Verrucomicrobiota bacterium]
VLSPSTTYPPWPHRGHVLRLRSHTLPVASNHVFYFLGLTLSLKSGLVADAPFGIDLATVIVHHDQDTVYTAHEWLRHVRLLDKVRISCALNGARDNTEMESFNGHFKAENSSRLWEA